MSGPSEHNEDCATEPKSKIVDELLSVMGGSPKPQRYVRPRWPNIIYRHYRVVEESAQYYIVKDDPMKEGMVHIPRLAAQDILLPKTDWELVPLVEWRDVTKECRFCTFNHAGRFIPADNSDYQVTVKQRVEVQG